VPVSLTGDYVTSDVYEYMIANSELERIGKEAIAA
jgi:hypothetical protein